MKKAIDLLRRIIMPRAKKVTKTATDTKQYRTYFMECKVLTEDSVERAVAEMRNNETITEDQARRISSVLKAVVSDSFSTIMGNRGI